MKPNDHPRTDIGGTRPAPTARKATLDTTPTEAHSTPAGSSASTSPPTAHRPLLDDAKSRIAYEDRLRDTRSTPPVVAVTAGVLVVAVAFAVYLFVVA